MSRVAVRGGSAWSVEPLYAPLCHPALAGIQISLLASTFFYAIPTIHLRPDIKTRRRGAVAAGLYRQWWERFHLQRLITYSPISPLNTVECLHAAGAIRLAEMYLPLFPPRWLATRTLVVTRVFLPESWNAFVVSFDTRNVNVHSSDGSLCKTVSSCYS